MVSATQQTTRRRKLRAQSAGRSSRAYLKTRGTPAFAIQPEGYDPKAADAKPEAVIAAPAAAKPAKASASKDAAAKPAAKKSAKKPADAAKSASK